LNGVSDGELGLWRGCGGSDGFLIGFTCSVLHGGREDEGGCEVRGAARWEAHFIQGAGTGQGDCQEELAGVARVRLLSDRWHAW
jgi:hypothetical protein